MNWKHTSSLSHSLCERCHTCPFWVFFPSQRGPSSSGSAPYCLCPPAQSQRRCDYVLYCSGGGGCQRSSLWRQGGSDHAGDLGHVWSGRSGILWCLGSVERMTEARCCWRPAGGSSCSRPAHRHCGCTRLPRPACPAGWGFCRRSRWPPGRCSTARLQAQSSGSLTGTNASAAAASQTGHCLHWWSLSPQWER